MTQTHLDESWQREKDACLWGIRCADGHVIHLSTKALRATWWQKLQEEAGMPGRRVPVALLRRSVPAGAWSEQSLV